MGTVENEGGRRSREGQDLGPARATSRPLTASASRTLELLRSRPEPVDLTALAGLAGLHPNTSREHLDVLVEAGLVARTRARARGRGRPPWLYAATAVRPTNGEYVGLATALAQVILRTSPDPRRDAELAGESWGRDLARRPGGASLTPEAARERAVELLEDLGFAPRREDPAGPVVRLTRCPLLDAARQNPRIVCNVHLGILRGVLAGLGADPEGSDLVPFAEPGSCLLIVPPVRTTPT